MRFLLSPPPEKEESVRMATRRSERLRTTKVVVLPTEDKQEEVKLGSGNTWGRDELRMLGVDFYRGRRIDLEAVLRVKDRDWSPELRARIPLLIDDG